MPTGPAQVCPRDAGASKGKGSGIATPEPTMVTDWRIEDVQCGIQMTSLSGQLRRERTRGGPLNAIDCDAYNCGQPMRTSCVHYGPLTRDMQLAGHRQRQHDRRRTPHPVIAARVHMLICCAATAPSHLTPMHLRTAEVATDCQKGTRDSPELIPRFMTTTFFAFHTFRTGMPAIGDLGSSAIGLTVSLAPD